MNASPTVEPLVIREKQYEPKVLTKVDDDLFYYDNYGDQPEFIRADQTYYDDLKREISAEVKEKPKKEDIKVHKEAYKVKKEIDAQQRALDELKKRKEKERKAMLKEELRLAKAEADERRRKEEELRLAQEKAEEEMLNAARKHIVNSAKIDEEPLVEAVKKEEIEFKTKNKL